MNGDTYRRTDADANCKERAGRKSTSLHSRGRSRRARALPRAAPPCPKEKSPRRVTRRFSLAAFMKARCAPYNALASAQPWGTPIPATWLYWLALHVYPPLFPEVHGVKYVL